MLKETEEVLEMFFHGHVLEEGGGVAEVSCWCGECGRHERELEVGVAVVAGEELGRRGAEGVEGEEVVEDVVLNVLVDGNKDLGNEDNVEDVGWARIGLVNGAWWWRDGKRRRRTCMPIFVSKKMW